MDRIYKALLDNKDILQNRIRFNDSRTLARSNGLGYLVDSYLGGMSHEEVMGVFKPGYLLGPDPVDPCTGTPQRGRFDAESFNRLITHFQAGR